MPPVKRLKRCADNPNLSAPSEKMWRVCLICEVSLRIALKTTREWHTFVEAKRNPSWIKSSLTSGVVSIGNHLKKPKLTLKCTMLLLLLTPNKILKKTENRVLLSVPEWGPSTAGKDYAH